MSGLGKSFFSFVQMARCQLFHCKSGVEGTRRLLNTQGGAVSTGDSLGKVWAWEVRPTGRNGSAHPDEASDGF